MRDLPLIDRAQLDLHTFGDTVLANELLALFAEQCRVLLPAISDNARTSAGRADLAHTLKGSASGVGASLVALHASNLEDALRRGSGEAELVRALSEAVAKTLDELPPST